MAETADYTVRFRVTSPYGDFSTDTERQEWREAGVPRQQEMLDATFGEFVRSLGGGFEVLYAGVAPSDEFEILPATAA